MLAVDGKRAPEGALFLLIRGGSAVADNKLSALHQVTSVKINANDAGCLYWYVFLGQAVIAAKKSHLAGKFLTPNR